MGLGGTKRQAKGGEARAGGMTFCLLRIQRPLCHTRQVVLNVAMKGVASGAGTRLNMIDGVI